MSGYDGDVQDVRRTTTWNGSKTVCFTILWRDCRECEIEGFRFGKLRHGRWPIWLLTTHSAASPPFRSDLRNKSDRLSSDCRHMTRGKHQVIDQEVWNNRVANQLASHNYPIIAGKDVEGQQLPWSHAPSHYAVCTCFDWETSPSSRNYILHL